MALWITQNSLLIRHQAYCYWWGLIALHVLCQWLSHSHISTLEKNDSVPLSWSGSTPLGNGRVLLAEHRLSEPQWTLMTEVSFKEMPAAFVVLCIIPSKLFCCRVEEWKTHKFKYYTPDLNLPSTQIVIKPIWECNPGCLLNNKSQDMTMW